VRISEAEYEGMVKGVKAKTTSAVENIPEEKMVAFMYLCNIKEIVRKFIHMLRAYIENI
jgi:hypothetical protein